MALFDMNDCRLWLKQNGHNVGDRGVISQKLQAIYFAAGTPKPERATVQPTPVRPSVPRGAVETTVAGEESSPSVSSPESATQRRGRKVLQPHHYDPRPSLFDADQLAIQRFWGIAPTRELWTIEDVMDIYATHGEAPLLATMTLREQDAQEIADAS